MPLPRRARRRWLAGLAGLTALAAPWVPPALASSGPAARADGAPKERAEVPEAAPLTLGGIRYEAPPWTRRRGLPNNGGYVEAFDAQTGRPLWLQKIYDPVGPPDLEADKREVFITTLEADPRGRFLIVTDERGRRWRLDLGSRRVVRLPEHRRSP
jgi:hypothetical protein